MIEWLDQLPQVSHLPDASCAVDLPQKPQYDHDPPPGRVMDRTIFLRVAMRAV